jgi:hypothetical protein
MNGSIEPLEEFVHKVYNKGKKFNYIRDERITALKEIIEKYRMFDVPDTTQRINLQLHSDDNKYICEVEEGNDYTQVKIFNS